MKDRKTSGDLPLEPGRVGVPQQIYIYIYIYIYIFIYFYLSHMNPHIPRDELAVSRDQLISPRFSLNMLNIQIVMLMGVLFE